MDPAPTLAALGLNQYEAKAYLALVRRDSATPAEVAQMAGLPRQRVYDVLRGLAERDLVVTVPGPQMRYAATAPDVAIAHLLDQRRAAVRSLETDAADLTEQLASLWLMGRREDAPLKYVEVLRDREAVGVRMAKLMDEVCEEYLVLVRPPYFGEPGPDEDVSDSHRIRAIYQRDALDLSALASYMRREQEAGAQIRIAESLPTKLAIADRRTVVLHLPDPVAGTPQFTTLIVDHPELAALMALSFEAIWATAETLPPGDH
jgi:sugar-specific transcriptional regulator TrmB